MNRLSVAWKNLKSDPLRLTLNLLLFSLGIGLSLYLLLINSQVRKAFEKNMAGIDMVIGAKGSDLQMIFCSMYHIDNPTGNISIDECKAFLKEQHPLIDLSVPLALGDSHKGYRIVGTDQSVLKLYPAELHEGKLWAGSGTVTLGSNVADILGLSLGQTFNSTHGFEDADGLEHDHEMVVTGILKPSGSVLDNLILTSIYTVWDNHDTGNHNHQDHSHEHHDHEDNDHEHHGHDHHDEHQHIELDRGHLITHTDKEITNILIKFKNRKNFQALNLPNNIRKHTNMQAANPPYILNQFYDRMGIGFNLLYWVAILICIVSSISIFISLYNALRARKYQLAILRVEGASPNYLFSQILLEGIMLSIIGYCIGVILALIGYTVTRGMVLERFQYVWENFPQHPGYFMLAGIALMIGVIASVIPAIRAFRIQIHETLSS